MEQTVKALKTAWYRLWGAPSDVDPDTDDWFPYMLQSTKFRQLLFVDFVVLLFAFTVVCLFHVEASPIVERALGVLEAVTVAYFGLNVVQKMIEYSRGGRRYGREGEDHE